MVFSLSYSFRSKNFPDQKNLPPRLPSRLLRGWGRGEEGEANIKLKVFTELPLNTAEITEEGWNWRRKRRETEQSRAEQRYRRGDRCRDGGQ